MDLQIRLKTKVVNFFKYSIKQVKILNLNYIIIHFFDNSRKLDQEFKK